MKLKNFELLETDVPKGVQAVLDFGKYHLSIVKSDFSYGGSQGKYEIGVFNANDGVASDMVELPGITNEGDTIKGWLTEAEVDGIIMKLYTATGTTPRQV
jgi:hypothetical protein